MTIFESNERLDNICSMFVDLFEKAKLCYFRNTIVTIQIQTLTNWQKWIEIWNLFERNLQKLIIDYSATQMYLSRDKNVVAQRNNDICCVMNCYNHLTTRCILVCCIEDILISKISMTNVWIVLKARFSSN